MKVCCLFLMYILLGHSNIMLKNVKNMPLLYGNTRHINLEHIYPKSFLNKTHHKEIHNIFASNGKMNSLRSNYKFGIGNYIVDHKKRIFVPRIEDRGIIARSLLFMNDIYSYTLKKVITEEELLYEWNKLYEPTEKEIIHNIYGHQVQGYDNPYITKYDELR
jgi:endonuclease I